MANNKSSSTIPSVVRRNGPTSSLATGKSQVVAYDRDGHESDDDTLLALSSLATMETTCLHERGFSQQEKVLVSSSATFDSSADYIAIVQQVFASVEDALVRCPKYARREALTELLMHAKLEQAKKATAYTSSCLQNANVWAEMLMQVQELGRNYPKDPQVHELVFLVQQCLARNEKQQGGWEEKTCRYDYREDVQQEHCDCNEEQDTLQPEINDDDTDVCNRRENVAVDDHSEDNNEGCYRITDERVPVMSNQCEDESDDRNYTKIERPQVDLTVGKGKVSPRLVVANRLRELDPILTGIIVLKGIEVPQLPRGSDICASKNSKSTLATSKIGHRTSRQKFQFPEKELLQFLENEQEPPPSPGPLRRSSHNSNITCTVPLRRKSFIMKRTSLKSSNSAEINALLLRAISDASEGRKAYAALPHGSKSITKCMAARRKSTSACHATAPSCTSHRRSSRTFSATKHQKLACTHHKQKSVPLTCTLSTGPLQAATTPSSPRPLSQTQMVLRVRARDGVPQLLIAKKSVRSIVWHWHDRCIRVPLMSTVQMMELGPAQHGIMLRQLRYVKSMMHDIPWAKAHLRSLLSRYTAKEVTKEELYPQLNALGQQVQREISNRVKHHCTLTARKHRLAITLTLATSLVNDTVVTKFGRRGRPHASRLLYDPTTPLQLRWRRKHGERSVEFLALDEMQVIEDFDHSSGSGGAASFGRGNKKAAAAIAVDPQSCLSLVTPTRSLDLQVASSLHREWLVTAVRDIVSFAQQFQAAHTANLSASSHSSDIMPPTRRSRQAPLTQHVLLF